LPPPGDLAQEDIGLEDTQLVNHVGQRALTHCNEAGEELDVAPCRCSCIRSKPLQRAAFILRTAVIDPDTWDTELIEDRNTVQVGQNAHLMTCSDRSVYQRHDRRDVTETPEGEDREALSPTIEGSISRTRHAIAAVLRSS
jgi:hypothetical protein